VQRAVVYMIMAFTQKVLIKVMWQEMRCDEVS